MPHRAPVSLLAFWLLMAAARAGIVFEGPVHSAAFGVDRFVRIWTPPSYQAAKDRRFPVLYVHDGDRPDCREASGP